MAIPDLMLCVFQWQLNIELYRYNSISYTRDEEIDHIQHFNNSSKKPKVSLSE